MAPESVDYVEAHGTGTRVGDPLEAGALSAVYGRGRPAGAPCLIGSVKSNIGHLEAGAGVASLIKVTLALANGEIPPSLNFATGNPAIDWSEAGLRVVSQRTPWPRGDRPRRAGVSGFGYGGTIGHVVLAEAPAGAVAAARPEEPSTVYPLSAGSEVALRQYAGALADSLPPDVPLASIGHTLALRRSRLAQRAAIVAADRDDLRAKLRLVADGEQAADVVTGSAAAGQGAGLVWVFSGHGSHWPGMGRQLLATEPVFARAVDELEPVLLEEIGFAPRQVLADGDLEGVDRIQTMIFVMQVGLAAVWRHHGVTPDAVIGHSVGEIAAAVAAGALTAVDGARLICRRSRLLRAVAGRGAMALASLPFDEVRERLAGRADAVPAISASPVSTVISGDPATIAELIERWGAEDIQVQRVASDVAFHSPQMDPLLARLAEAASDLSPRRPRIPMYSTALTDPRATPLVDGAYWAANLRNPVRLAAATAAASADGYRAFLEISAHPVVTHSIAETLAEHGVEDAFVGATLRRDQPERSTLLTAIGAAHCNGVGVNWASLHGAGELVTLPPVAWQRRPHWHEATPTDQGRTHDVDTHALLGAEVSVAGRPLRLWQTWLTGSSRPYPGSHTINGVEIVPAAVLINTFLSATGSALDTVSLRLPLIAGERHEVQVGRDEGRVWIASREPGGDWLTCSTASACGGEPLGPMPTTVPPHAADPGEVREHLAAAGVPTMAFEWTVRELFRGEGMLRARVQVPDVSTWAPTLDAALSIAPTLYPGRATLRMVTGIDRVQVDATPPGTADVLVTLDADRVDVVIADAGGTVLARLSGVRYGGVGSGSVGAHELVHEIGWRPVELAAEAPVRDLDLVLVGGAPELVEAIRARVPSCRVELAAVRDCTDVLVLPPDSGGSVPEDAARSAWRLLDVAGRLDTGRLWGITAGVRECRAATHLAQSPVWGTGRVLAGERDDLWGGVVDLPGDDPASAVDTLLRVLRTGRTGNVLAVRGGAAYAARLHRTERVAQHGPVVCRPDGTYLITGGLGGLGLRVARWLAERGARRLVLASRRAVPPRSAWDPAVRKLEDLGATVRLVSLDIADAEATGRVLDPDALGLPPIRGIVHAAGVLDNRLVHDVDENSLREVLRPKVAGGWVLHCLFPPGSLDFFVLFSSCGQLLGLPGQASYGAANAFLDALSAYRGDAISFGWTSWRGQGMAVNEVVDRELRARGTTDISAAEAFAAWDFAARRGTGHFPVLATVPLEPGADRLPVLSEITVLSGETDGSAASTGDGESFTGLAPEELRERLLAEVGGQIAREMRLSVSALDLRRSLVEQGLDSVMTIVVRRRLEKRFGHKLPTTLLWHHPSVSAITDHLIDVLTA